MGKRILAAVDKFVSPPPGWCDMILLDIQMLSFSLSFLSVMQFFWGLLDSGKALLQIGDDVVDVLCADGEANGVGLNSLVQ